MNGFYSLMYAFSQCLRKKNYKLYRKLVESSFFQKTIQCFFGKSFVEVTTPEGYKLVINPVYHGSYLTKESISHYETDMRALFASLVRPGMVIYDVGANVGVFSLFFLKGVGKEGVVYAFEPEKNNNQCLMKTKDIGHLENFKIQNICVGEKSGFQMFDRRGGAFSGQLINGTSLKETKNNIVSVEVVSLDDFVFQSRNNPPHLVKIDIEGHEFQVIQGMRKVISQFKPVIVCELHLSLNPQVKEIFTILSENGYRCYSLQSWLNGKKDVLKFFEEGGHIIAVQSNS